MIENPQYSLFDQPLRVWVVELSEVSRRPSLRRRSGVRGETLEWVGEVTVYDDRVEFENVDGELLDVDIFDDRRNTVRKIVELIELYELKGMFNITVDVKGSIWRFRGWLVS